MINQITCDRCDYHVDQKGVFKVDNPDITPWIRALFPYGKYKDSKGWLKESIDLCPNCSKLFTNFLNNELGK